MHVASAIDKVKAFVNAHSLDRSHSLEHFLAVLDHVQNMIKHHQLPILTEEQKENLNLAALLHDVDDRKFFPHQGKNTYIHARTILSELFTESQSRIEQIINLIELVSTSTNGNTISVAQSEIWMLYPRFADRLEAIGKIGVRRCREYSEHVKDPLFLPTTIRCQNEEELWKVATPERFVQYLNTKRSDSFIDHFYDKLLHIGTKSAFGECDNSYLISEAATRHQYMIDYVLKFGKSTAFLLLDD